jgi:hypothetical protein
MAAPAQPQPAVATAPSLPSNPAAGAAAIAPTQLHRSAPPCAQASAAPAPAPPPVSAAGAAALARLLAPLPPPAAPAPHGASYTTLPLLSTLLHVDEALERRTAHAASAGTGAGSCAGTLKFAEEHTHTTILRARGIVATFPALWSECVGERGAASGRAALRAPRGPLSHTPPPPSPSRAHAPLARPGSWSEEGRLQRILSAGARPGL